MRLSLLSILLITTRDSHHAPLANAFIIPSSQSSAFLKSQQSASREKYGSTLSLSTTTSSSPVDDYIFSPLKRFFGGKGDDNNAPKQQQKNDYDDAISECKIILNRAVESKKEDPEEVIQALEDLEKLMRQKRKAEPQTAASSTLTNLNGVWRLVFTTGTKDTQKKRGGKTINYFPLKAVQAFDTTVDPMGIRNGIYVGDLKVLEFDGDFEFDLVKSKLEFDFDRITVFGFTINLPKGKAAEIGSATGLGSDNNVKLVEKKKKPFFNWISADDTIATARGGGGGLALWKRVTPDD